MYGGVMADLVTMTVRDRPTVVTFHGSDLLGEQLSGIARRVIAGFGVWSSSRAARRATGIVTVSERLQAELPTDVDRTKIRIIPCGIDLARFRPMDREACRRDLGWRPDRFHVVFPSNSGNPVKRPALARAAVAAAKQLGVPAELHYLRGVPNTDVPLWMNASDVLLLTSLHEGSPTVVKEALACNLPVVSVNVGDVDEQLRGVPGCHVAPADSRELAMRMRTVYATAPDVVAERRARVQHLSIERIAARLQHFYADVMTSFANRSTAAIEALPTSSAGPSSVRNA